MTEFKKHRKTSERISKLADRNRRALKCIVGRKHRTTAAKATTELNQHLNSPVSTKALHHELNKEPPSENLYSTIKIQERLKWCRDHKGWSTDQWKHVIFSNESNFFLLLTAGEVYVWKQPGEAYKSHCFFPQRSTEVDQLWFGQPCRGILSVSSLSCMV